MDYYSQIRTINGRKLMDADGRQRLDDLEDSSTLYNNMLHGMETNLALKYLWANSATEYDSSGKYTEVYSEDSKMEHESSLMLVDGEIATAFILNLVDTTDCTSSSKNAKFVVYKGGDIINLEDETGYYVGTARTQHADDEDVIIGGGYDSDGNAKTLLVRYSADDGWTASEFTNNSGVSLGGKNGQMVYEDGKFYHVVDTATVTTTFPLVYFDIENMTVELVANLTLPYSFSGTCEASLYKFNSKYYVALRPAYTVLSSSARNYQGLALVGILDSLENPEITDWIYLPDGSSRPLFFDYKSHLFIMTNDYDRVNGHLFDITDFYCPEPIANIKYNVNYADFYNVDGTLYWSATSRKNTSSGCKVVTGEFVYSSLLT